MKCPACGFDSPDDAAWCDFCKEPFRKRSPQPSELEPGRPPAPVPAEPKRNGAPRLEEFAHLDAGERMPILPSWVRGVAIAIVAIWLLVGFVVLGFYVGKQRARGGPPPAEGGDSIKYSESAVSERRTNN